MEENLHIQIASTDNDTRQDHPHHIVRDTRYTRLQQNIPQLIQQPAASQQAYCAHEIVVAADSVTGAPLTLPFVAVYDRSPAQGEGDIVLSAQDLLDVTIDRF